MGQLNRRVAQGHSLPAVPLAREELSETKRIGEKEAEHKNKES